MRALKTFGMPTWSRPWATGIITCMALLMFSTLVAMFGFLAEPASTR
jgi:hypothetical protein